MVSDEREKDQDPLDAIREYAAVLGQVAAHQVAAGRAMAEGFAEGVKLERDGEHARRVETDLRDELVCRLVEALEMCMTAEAVSHVENAQAIADHLIQLGWVDLSHAPTPREVTE